MDGNHAASCFYAFTDLSGHLSYHPIFTYGGSYRRVEQPMEERTFFGQTSADCWDAVWGWIQQKRNRSRIPCSQTLTTACTASQGLCWWSRTFTKLQASSYQAYSTYLHVPCKPCIIYFGDHSGRLCMSSDRLCHLLWIQRTGSYGPDEQFACCCN